MKYSDHVEPEETLFVDDQVRNIRGAVAGAVCLEIPGRPLHFIRLQNPADFEIDKDVVYRAFTRDADAVRNANGTVWAVPIPGPERRLGVVYVQLGKDPEKKADLIAALQVIADITEDEEFPENFDQLF